MRNVPPRGSSTSLGMTRVCLAKTLYFACLLRHATCFFLLCSFAAERRSCFSADAKTWITIPITGAEAARDSASFGRNCFKFVDQHNRHRRPD